MKNLLAEYEEYLRCELCRSPHTVRAYIADTEAFALWAASDGIETFDPRLATTADIRAWLASLSKGGLKATSVRRRLQSLRTFYRYLMRRGLLADNPAADVATVRTPSRLPEFIKPEDVEAVFETSGGEGMEEDVEHLRDNLIIEMLYVTGIRRAELLGIRDSDIDRSRGEVKVVGKRRKERILPLAPQMLGHIAEYQRLRDEAWPGEGDRPLLATPRGAMSETTLYRIVRRELAGASAGRKSPHTLRHTFATAMLNEGASLTDVKEFLGHSSLSTTQIYTHVSFADLMKAYDSAHPRSKEH